MPRLTRRKLLHVGAKTAALAVLSRTLLPRPLLADFGGARPVPVPPILDPDVKQLALRAVDACRAAGANYADVRMTHTYMSNAPIGNVIRLRKQWLNQEQITVGVRALVNGYWGFASSQSWSHDEMDRLAKSAVHLATINALGKPRPVDLVPAPKVADGHWSMPVKLDPFAIDPAEIYDVVNTLNHYVERYHWRGGKLDHKNTFGGPNFQKQSKAFASTEGSYCTQELYRSSGSFFVSATRDRRDAGGGLDFLSPAGMGFELYRDHDLQAAVFQLLDEIDADLHLSTIPVDLGRYDLVMDARSVASLVSQTIGRATELDRALGYEANATGTSYVNDPFTMIGSYQMGAPSLTLSANRSEPGGCATVQWDDDGVTPEPFTLVKDGVLTDFHTTRESARWLEPYYQKHQMPVRSHGCASTPMALDAPLTHTPNLTLAPGGVDHDFDALVGTLKRGVALKSWSSDIDFDMDFQCLNGISTKGTFYKVRDGRCVSKLGNACVRFRAPELWKGVIALGGASSVRRYGVSETKGEPSQETFHSVTAPAAVFKDLALVDVTRQA